MDEQLIKTIYERGLRDDFNLIEKLDKVSRTPRYLDDIPDRIKAVSTDMGGEALLGEAFKLVYKQLEIDRTKPCYLKILDTQTEVSYEVMCTLKALLIAGIHEDDNVAVACRAVFQVVMFGVRSNRSINLIITDIEALVGSVGLYENVHIEGLTISVIAAIRGEYN